MIKLDYLEQLAKEDKFDFNYDLGCIIHHLRTHTSECPDATKCKECWLESLKWLKEEYIPAPELSKFEYDLLSTFHEASRFDSVPVLRLMKSKGYYQGVLNTTDTIKHISATAKIVN